MNKKLTQNELIRIVAKENDLTLASTETFIKAFLGSLKDCLLQYGSVPLHGIGVLELRDVEARSGVNMLKGEASTWSKPAHKTVKFKVSKVLKDEVFNQSVK